MLYKRPDSANWWYSFTFHGKRIQESSKVKNRKEAETKEAGRRVQLAKGEVGLADKPRFTINQLLDRLKARWEMEDKTSTQNLSLLKKCKEDWGAKMADDVTVEQLERYAVNRQREKYAPSTTNRIFQALRRAFHLANVPWPKFELLKEENIRTGFIVAEQMEKVLAQLPDDGLRDFVRFLHVTGVRRGEAASLRWSYLEGGEIVVPAECCKSRKPHIIPVAGPLVGIMERRKAARAFQANGTTSLSEYLFHRGDGLPILEFRKSWRTATKAAGCGNLLPHDLRRSASRDMLNGGVPQAVAMRITGHKTDSMFRRYAIVTNEDMAAALERTAAFRAHSRG